MIPRQLNPRAGVSYFRGRRQGNAVPAVLLLFGVLVLLMVLRRHTTPNMPELVTLGAGAAIIVALATVLPELVTLFLVGLVIAAVLGTPQLVPFLEAANQRVASLAQPRS